MDRSGAVAFYPHDVRGRPTCERRWRREKTYGRIDVLVNNAGVNTYFDAATMTEAEWDQVFAVDLKGAWLCSKHALPAMKARAAARS